MLMELELKGLMGKRQRVKGDTHGDGKSLAMCLYRD